MKTVSLTLVRMTVASCNASAVSSTVLLHVHSLIHGSAADVSTGWLAPALCVCMTGDRGQPTRAVVVWALEELRREERNPDTARQNAKAETLAVKVSCPTVIPLHCTALHSLMCVHHLILCELSVLIGCSHSLRTCQPTRCCQIVPTNMAANNQ